MEKQPFDRRKGILAILVVFLVIISMTSTVVSAAGEYREKHQGDGHHYCGGSGYQSLTTLSITQYDHVRYNANCDWGWSPTLTSGYRPANH
jgi:hypothetical protein